MSAFSNSLFWIIHPPSVGGTIVNHIQDSRDGTCANPTTSTATGATVCTVNYSNMRRISSTYHPENPNNTAISESEKDCDGVVSRREPKREAGQT
jgi:hypothetical protein